MMKPRLAVAGLMLSLWAGSASAQAPQMPTLGPEHQRLLYYVGDWHTETTLKPGSMGPGGKMTGTDHNEMLPGGFFLVLHSDDDSPMGQIHELAIMGYDSGKKAYTYNSFNNFGEAEVYTGAVEGNTWTWTAPIPMNGKMINSRFTTKEASPSSYTFKFDVSPDGSTWTNIMEGTATKTK
jgi:hypothetical protein